MTCIPRIEINTSRDSLTVTAVQSKFYFISTPEPAGYWKFGGNIKLPATKRPRWLTRQMMRWFFEWEWEDQL